MSAEDLLEALRQLADAHGASALASAHHRLRRMAWKRRKAADQPDLKLAKTVEAALVIREQMKAAGADPATLNAGLEQVLREMWPKPKNRTEPWRYECEDCNDTGLIIMQCGGSDDSRCGRVKPHGPHDFGQPCFCKRGPQFRDKPPAGADLVKSAAKVSKPTRFGQR